MKKLILITAILALILALFALPASAEVSVTIDGETIECVNAAGLPVSPILVDGTTYLPVRAVANALELDIAWDNDTRSVFINGAPESAEKGDEINIFINGAKFTAKDAAGNTVNPILYEDTTYLPIRAIGEAFDKNISWDQETQTAGLVTPAFKTDFDENKTYAIINKANGKAISVLASGLGTEVFGEYDYQAFKLIPSDIPGYYNVRALQNDKNFDVNGNSMTPGANIITYNPGSANNQLFAFVEEGDDLIIYARSSKLPIEDSADKVKQNAKRDAIVQKWEVVEFTPVSSEKNSVYRTLTIDSLSLTDSDGLMLSPASGEDTQKWILDPDSDAEYTITNLSTKKSLDVANNSKTSGDPIITYATSGDPNQRWIFEKTENGTYLIKSVHSSLYLTASGNSVVHAERSDDAKQEWTVSITE